MYKGLVVALLLCSSCFAKDRTPHAPLADKIVKAQTIFIENDTGYSDIADNAFAELQDWKRFKVVTDASKADVILRFTLTTEAGIVINTANAYGPGVGIPTTRYYTVITAIDPANSTSMWSDTYRWGRKSSTRACIKALRSRIEEQEKK